MTKQPLVLFVASNALTRRDVVRGLESYGHTVITAADGEEALALLDAHGRRIGVLVADADMKGEVDGLAVAKRARNINPRLSVIYTARLPHVIPSSAQVNGAPLVRTPYHPHQLASVISMLRHDVRSPGEARIEVAA